MTLTESRHLHTYMFYLIFTFLFGSDSVLKMEDFAMNTRQEFQRLCNFVGSDCTEKIINTVVQKTHHIPHLTRNDVKWDKRSVQVINNFIRENLGEFYNPLDMK